MNQDILHSFFSKLLQLCSDQPLDPVGTLYSVGMAAGYLERDPRTNLLVKDSAGNNIVHDQGRITNSGTINVVGKDSTGMYGAGSNTVITNDTNGDKKKPTNWLLMFSKKFQLKHQKMANHV